MTVVGQWTGATAAQLRSAMRMTVRGFADHLGVSPRTVTGWETGDGARVPNPDSQEMLDTALRLADQDVRRRFSTMRTAAPPIPAWAATSTERGRQLAEALAGTNPYRRHDEAVSAVRNFVTANRHRVQVITGDAGLGKSRLSYHLCTALADTADVQWHACSASAWGPESTVEAVAAEILRYGSLAPDGDPITGLEQAVAALARPLVVVVDAISGQGEFDAVAGHLDALLRYVTDRALRFVVMVRTPPAPRLAMYPVLAAGTTRHRLQPWSMAVARAEWHRHDDTGAFDELPAEVRGLARVPLFFHLLQAAPTHAYARNTLSLIEHCVHSVGERPHPRQYARIAWRQLLEVVPDTVPAPDDPDDGTPPPLSPFLHGDNDSIRFVHDILAEYFAAVHIADHLSHNPRAVAAIETLNELARRSRRSASARGLLRLVIQALDRLGHLSAIANSPLADPATTLPHVVAETQSPSVVAACARRCVDADHAALARAVLVTPRMPEVLGADWTSWFATVLVEFGDRVWKAAATCAEHTLTADEATRLAGDLDSTDVKQAVWLARHLHLLDSTPHTVNRLINHPNWQVRAGLAHAAVACPQVTTLDNGLDTLLEDDDYRVRAAVVTVLTNPRSLHLHLERLLLDDNWHVRRATVDKVVEWNDTDLTKTTRVAILDNPQWLTCRSEARESMQRLLLLNDPDQYCDVFPVATWKLLRENTTGHRRLASDTEATLRSAAGRSPVALLRREATHDTANESILAPSRPEAWRRLRGHRNIQVALDVHDIDHAITIAHAVVAAGCELIEVGDPLIKTAGTAAITRIKEQLPDTTVIAEMMATDWGRDQVESAATAGADAVLLSGPVNPASVAEASDTGHRFGVPVILDVPTTATPEWIREMESVGTGIDGLCVTANIDLGHVGQTPLERAEALRQHTRLPIAVSGGFSPDERLRHGAWDILIVGRAITDAIDPHRIATRFAHIAQHAEGQR